jgi:hypothetical protein
MSESEGTSLCFGGIDIEAYSLDLRERVVASVEGGGITARGRRPVRGERRSGGCNFLCGKGAPCSWHR